MYAAPHEELPSRNRWEWYSTAESNPPTTFTPSGTRLNFAGSDPVKHVDRKRSTAVPAEERIANVRREEERSFASPNSASGRTALVRSTKHFPLPVMLSLWCSRNSATPSRTTHPLSPSLSGRNGTTKKSNCAHATTSACDPPRISTSSVHRDAATLSPRLCDRDLRSLSVLSFDRTHHKFVSLQTHRRSIPLERAAQQRH